MKTSITIRDERGYNQIYAAIGSTIDRQKRRKDWFVDYIRARGARRVLELGCGTGETAHYIAAATDAEVVAVDISQHFLDKAAADYNLPNLSYRRFDLLAESPTALGHFDLVYGNGILHHLVERLSQVLTRMRETVGPSGAMAFIEPNLLNPYAAFIFGTAVGRRWARLEPDEMAFTPGQLRRSLASAGWKDIEVKTRDFLIPGLPRTFVRPIIAVEPLLEATPVTSWLAQSNFIVAQA